MSRTTNMTADQLADLPDDGNRYELVAGELRMMSPSGWKHGRTTSKLNRLLGNFIEQQRLGTTFWRRDWISDLAQPRYGARS